MRLCSYLGCAGLDYPGVIDDVEIWSRALSATEIQALSTAPRGTVCSTTTNSSGVATCRSGLLTLTAVLVSSSYTASYGGSGDFSASSTTPPVSLLGVGLNVCRTLKHKATAAARSRRRCTAGTPKKHRRRPC